MLPSAICVQWTKFYMMYDDASSWEEEYSHSRAWKYNIYGEQLREKLKYCPVSNE